MAKSPKKSTKPSAGKRLPQKTPAELKKFRERGEAIAQEMADSINKKHPAPTLSLLALQAKEYWQEELQTSMSSSELESMLETAEQKYHEELSSLEEQFPDNQMPSQMKEELLQAYLFPKPLQEPAEEMPDSQAFESLRDLRKMYEALDQIEEEESAIPYQAAKPSEGKSKRRTLSPREAKEHRESSERVAQEMVDSINKISSNPDKYPPTS